MRQFFITILGSIIGFFIALFLVFVLLGVIGAMAASSLSGGNKTDEVTSKTVLTLDLRKSLQDQSRGEPLFGDQGTSVVDIVRSLHHAKDNKAIKGLLIRANNYSMSPTYAEEISVAINDFKSSGKFVIAHAQGFEGTSLANYLAVSSADEIWLQETTGFALAGYRLEVEFLGGVFEKFDADPEFIQFYEYKNAANAYTQKTMTPAHRESMTALVNSLFESSANEIMKNRELSREQFDQILDGSPHSAEDALKLGMVDKLGHWVDAKDYAKEKAGTGAVFKNITDYSTGFKSGPVIALIGGQGTVVMGSSQSDNPFSTAVAMGGDTVSSAILKAAKNKDVKAIVFRLNTPGGSATASDQIWDAVERAKEAGKPVVVSMGQYAASGGYYVSANADKIVAMPTTITGSIGVLGGKVVIKDTLAKIGYNVEAVEKGGHYNSAYSAFEPWDQANREGVRRSMEDIYIDFTQKVADGRNIPIEKVREIAKGRVWTGEQAKEIGLVDELGGLIKAIDVAKDLAEIKDETGIKLRQFPRPKTQQEQLMEIFNATATLSSDLKDIRALTQSPEYQAFLKSREAMQMQGQMQLQAAPIEIK